MRDLLAALDDFDAAGHRLAQAPPAASHDTSHDVWAACVATMAEHLDKYPADSHEWAILRAAYVALLRHEPPEPQWRRAVAGQDRQVVTARQAAARYELNGYEMAAEDVDNELARRGLGLAREPCEPNGPLLHAAPTLTAERYGAAPPRQPRRAA